MRSLLIGLFAAVGVGGCGSSGGGSPQPDGGTSHADAPIGAVADASVDGPPVDAAPLLAPYFEMLKPDSGGLKLTWTNMTPDCDHVEVWRKDALDPYATISMPPGSNTTYIDTTATLNINYTYRLRCVKGTGLSPYSFEMSANPLM